MALKDIHERLYSRDLSEEQRSQTKPSSPIPENSEQIRPTVRQSSAIGGVGRTDWKAASQVAFKKKKLADRLQKGKRPRWQMISLIVGGAVFVVAAGVLSYLYIFRNKDTFDPQSVAVEIVAPDSVASGEEVTYTVRVSNGAAVALTNTQLFFQKPTGFTLTSSPGSSSTAVETSDLGVIAAGQTSTVEFRGRILGERNSIQTAKVTVRYIPENFPQSTFEGGASFDLVISSVPLTLSGSAQEELASGGEVVYTLSYLNNSPAVYKDLILDVAYPEGFVFTSATPPPTSRTNVWELGDVSKTTQPQQVEIRGSLSGSEGESKVFTARLFSRSNGSEIVFAEDHVSVRIAQSPFTLQQTINGAVADVANLGDELEYTVAYSNASQIALSRAVINVQLQSRALDLSRLRVDGGAFNAATSTIVWDASGVPELALLAPGASGTVTFRVDVLNLLTIDSNDDKNFSIVTVATIDSPDVPQPVASNKIVTSNTLTLKVNSRLIVQAKGFFNDPAGVVNSGPIPPSVGSKTTYSVHWQVLNVNNDATDVVVRTVLPPGVRFEGQVSVTGGKNLRYDDRTGELVWELGSVAAHTGLRIPSQEAIFIISITPAPSDAGRAMPLTASSGAATITGKDAYTAKDLSNTAPAFTTDLPDDPSLPRDSGVVVSP